MSKFRFASAVSLVALGSMIAGCAAPQGRTSSASGFGGRADGEIGLATRALAALNANDVNSAIGFAERAVEATPDDAGFRGLLGNAYFAAGRFVSAEAAYKDSLAIYGAQPQVVLKLALVEIAQGKNSEALGVLDSAQPLLDPADYGLALALAGHGEDAVSVLESVARAPGADARVRQNLALAYGLVGDWQQARTVASQDVPADQLDGRIQHWMQLSKPARASDQVAALTGVVPATVDPGQPTRLALRGSETRQAQAAPAPAPVAPAAAPQPQFAAAAPVPQFVAPAPPPQDPVRVPAPVADPAPLSVAQAPLVAPEAPAAFAAFAPKVEAAAPARPAEVRHAAAKAPAARNPVLRGGKSSAVVQLGAYGSRERVAVAWDLLTKRYPRLREYAPMTARFESSKGTVYRLSIKGFDNQQEAIARCNALKGNGGACFVRNVAGDAPIQYASR
jgi:Flp pilus assembly protein TadD